MNNTISVDDKALKSQLKELKSNSFKKYLKGVTGVGIAVAKKAAQDSVASLVSPGGKSLKRYIKAYIHRDDPGVGEVNILGKMFKSKKQGQKIITHPYYLRFFEPGTKERFLKKRNGKTLKKQKSLGKIPTYRFFTTAMSSVESKVFSEMRNRLSEIILKVDSKNK